ncbi:hypothetical protein Bbelb_075860 [Branchiostoma belcheri]|nr:hypothetical protein Bbelb_075860 [Branchiostoma belcheri]
MKAGKSWTEAEGGFYITSRTIACRASKPVESYEKSRDASKSAPHTSRPRTGRSDSVNRKYSQDFLDLLVISKDIYKCLQSINPVSQRILSATFHGNPETTVTVVYAPTESANTTEKDDFYSTLKDHLERVKPHNKHLVVGDFNARLGMDSHVTHPAVIGPHCFYSETNDNGERLVNLCQEHKLRPAQSRFPQPSKRLWTWMHPGGSTQQLDHILINGKWLNSLRNCRAYNSVELDSDHRILSVMLVSSLRTSKGKPCRRPKFNWKKLRTAETKKEFQVELSNRFQGLAFDDASTPITKRYGQWEKAVAETAEKVVGKCKPTGAPSWVSERTLKLREERNQAKKRYLLAKTRQAREAWRKLNDSLNNSYRSDELDFLNQQLENLQEADKKGDYNTTWKIVNSLAGKGRRPSPRVKKRDGSAPSSDSELLDEWRLYFADLLNNDSGPPESLPPPADRDLPISTDPPTLEETVKAIQDLKNNKAPGLDCAITGEALQGGGYEMAKSIHTFCTEVFTTLTPPEQWITNVIIPLPKKGDLTLMTNYRGISLMSVAAKVYNKILLMRIREHVDPILRKNQAGFRPSRSCAQQIHILRRIMEGFLSYQLPLTVTFIDFKKAFDCINRRVMFSVLRHYGIPEVIVNAIQVLYYNSKSAVFVDGNISDPFQVTTGVLQGDVLAPFLFIVLIDYLLLESTKGTDSGVVTHPRQSRRHPAQTLNDLDFADDIALLESTIPRAQEQLTKTAAAGKQLGLIISVPKTEYMTYNCNPQLPLEVYGQPIRHVANFKYLGSMMASSSHDMAKRKSLAWTAFWKLEKIWRSPSISTSTKLKLFNTTCVTILLYGCESWVITGDMENKLNAFATSCYRVMLNIKRLDHVSNAWIYKLTNTRPLITMVRQRQLRFLGHALRMPLGEPCRTYALYVPTHGKRRPGRQRLDYLGYVRNLLGDTEGDLRPEDIANLAADRRSWGRLVVDCSAAGR